MPDTRAALNKKQRSSLEIAGHGYTPRIRGMLE
jgi:hypothetical protein